MLVRRVVALLAGLSSLALGVESGGVRCEQLSHGAHFSAHVSSLEAVSAMPADCGHQAPTQSSSPGPCCRGVASCGPTITFSTELAFTDLTNGRSQVFPRAAFALAGLVLPPEPPPPKA
jgi:hypothetical protein